MTKAGLFLYVSGDETPAANLLSHEMASFSTAPTLHYFPILGRGEPIRMTFALCGVPYEEQPVDFGKMKAEAGTAASPFGQAPFVDFDGVRLSQMTAIMRYIAATARPALCGATPLDRARVDMVLNAVDDLYLKYIDVVYGGGLADDAKATLWAAHFARESMTARNGGAHLGYLASFLERSGGPFLLGAEPTLADVFFFFTLEAYARGACFGGRVVEAYPALGAYMTAVGALDGLKDRLADPKREPLPFNGNGKG